MDMTREEEAAFDMSDEELEAAFKAAKADADNEIVDEEIVDEGLDREAEEDAETLEENEGEEDEELEELEQPDEQDSDDDASEDDGEEEVEDEDSEDGEEDPDGDAEPDEEQAEEEAEDSKEETQPVQEIEKMAFKANGREYEFTVDEMKEQFGRVFGQAMDYTKKMQAIKPHRKTIDAIEQAEMSHDDVNLMIDVLKGDKGALQEVIKRTGIDTLDLDTEGETVYTPKDYGRDDTTLAIKDVVDEISADKEYDTTHRVISKDWDESSWNEMSRDPELIRLLHVDVKSGMYDKVQPIADKLKLYGRGAKSDLEYYKEAAGVYFQEEAQEKARLGAAEEAKAKAEAEAAEKSRLDAVVAKQAKQKTVKKAATKRKAAAPTKKAAGTKRSIDYLDDSDEAFEDWYKKNVEDKY
jgi:hypothetical protein